MSMTSKEIRQSFLDFFESKQHTIVKSGSLLPDAPNLLFTNAGMNQFVPIFLGQANCPYTPAAPPIPRNASAPAASTTTSRMSVPTPTTTPSSKCSATGRSATISRRRPSTGHGNCSPRSGVSRKSASMPPTSAATKNPKPTWKPRNCGSRYLPEERVVPGNRKDNFWMMGDTGPCGPCSELHVDLTPEGNCGAEMVNADSADCIEIWNLVFIQFNANADGSYSPLPAQHVDTGMGFERACSIIQCTKNFTDFSGIISNYETDVFTPIFQDAGRNERQDNTAAP